MFFFPLKNKILFLFIFGEYFFPFPNFLRHCIIG
jgi:hypothetical protein